MRAGGKQEKRPHYCVISRAYKWKAGLTHSFMSRSLYYFGEFFISKQRSSHSHSVLMGLAADVACAVRASKLNLIKTKEKDHKLTNGTGTACDRGREQTGGGLGRDTLNLVASRNFHHPAWDLCALALDLSPSLSPPARSSPLFRT